MNRAFWGILFAATLFHFSSFAADKPISLAGTWRFQLDRADVGESEQWFGKPLAQKIQLPGALQNQGFGDDISVDTKWTANVNDRTWFTSPKFEKYRQPGNVKVPFWLQPDKHYVGAAWYQREIEIPAAWQRRRVVLTLERPHWETRVWLDNKLLGTNDSLSTPHVYELGTDLKPGKHTLTIRVDNRLIVNVGVWAHSVSDHTQGNWNGVVGKMELSTTSPVWMEDVQAYPNVARKSVLFKVRIENSSGKAGAGKLTAGTQPVVVHWDEKGGSANLEITLGHATRLWDEFSPALAQVRVTLSGDSADDQRDVKFGLREITTTPDKMFAINGRKTFLRGTLECCIFPLTGYPPTDVDSWKRIIKIAQAHGLNHIRFHSWCPPEAAFAAADELGCYYQVEIAAWTTVGDGGSQDAWLYKEAERILRAYGNHPSFILMPYGNEPGGSKQKQWLAEWVNHWKALDSRRLYTSGSGWPSIDESQYHVTPAGRGPSGFIGKDYREQLKNLKAPVIVHEMAQWCVYPNFDEIKKYKGPLKAKNFEIFRDTLTEHGMLDQWRDFLRASGKIQALCYKEEIEAAMRTPGVSGVQLLDLHDFPGQGTALVGILDAFWDEKGYISPEEFRRFYNTTVPLTRMEKRVWTSDEIFKAQVEVNHFGAKPIENAVAYWKLNDARGRAVASGELPAKTLPVDRGIELGEIQVDFSKLPARAARLQLVVGIKGTPFENDWTIFVYPDVSKSSWDGVEEIPTTLDEKVLARLNAGGNVLLLATKLSAEHPRGSWTPVFWNKQWFPSQSCQTLGLLCNPKHPALAAFPTEFWSDWQWEDIVRNSRCMLMDDLPKELRPIVQVIDDWNTNRKLGLVFECRVGKGKLLICSADLTKNFRDRHAARQLLGSLIAYLHSKDFDPKVEVSKEDLIKMLERTKPSKMAKLGAKVLEADSEDRENGNVAANAIDGDPDTFWHTRWSPSKDPMPHSLVIDLGKEITLQGVTYLPRQDMENGRVAQAEIFCSNDPKAWGDAVAKPKFRSSGSVSTVQFKQPVKARYLKFVATAEVRQNPFAAVAELDVITEDK
jgi:hypothetical protein